MTEEFSQNLHAALERDIEQLTLEINRRREMPETKSYSSKELIRQSLSVFAQYSAQAQVEPQDEKGEVSILPAYMKDAPAENKLLLEKLLDISLHHGIARGLREAKKAGPHFLDAFHDALVEKLYPELKRRGIVA
jgi:hypothetical protein